MLTYCNYKNKEKDCKLTLECGKIFNPILPPRLNDDLNNPMMPPVKLASVTVDTRTLCYPCVNIKYSSIINLLGVSSGKSTITLKFRLVKECKNEIKEILQEWEYEKSGIDDDENEREFKDSFSIDFCQCIDCFHDGCCTYTIELVKAAPSLDNEDPEVRYSITNKNISACVSCEDHLKCGKIFNPSLPPRLNDDPNNPMMAPVKLASVTVDTRSLYKPCIKIQYSSIINLLAIGGNSETITLGFRLIKECKGRREEILKEWEYTKSDIDSGTNEGMFKDSSNVTFCECIDCFHDECCTYTIELVKAAPSLDLSDNPEIAYNITNKNISALIACDSHFREKEKSCRPILECGKIFNPSLPNMLEVTDPPVKLASVTINTKGLCKPCVNIQYSTIINLLAIGGNSETITLGFRLTKECKKGRKETLQEWKYQKSDIDDDDNERLFKDSFNVNFCECVDCFDDECCTYTIELIEVVVSQVDTIIYKFTNTTILAIGACESH
ncbi:DUF4489 domain-containing protein [Anaeromicrobium sediminis]|nr:DUF4489 domain-containing protein [Anaeromicrobium sediminis]